MKSALKKIRLRKLFFLSRKRLFLFVLFCFSFSILFAASFYSAGSLRAISDTTSQTKDVKVKINKDTLLIFTKDVVIVSRINQEQSKLFEDNTEFNKNIEAVIGKKNPDSKYLVLYADIKDNLNVVNELGNDISVAQIIHDHEHPSVSNFNKIILFIIILLPLVLLGFYFRKGKKASKENYENILENLKISDSPTLTNPTDDSENALEHKPKLINITDETVKHVLSKLSKFEKSQKYLKQDMSLSSLATYLDTNTKYLSEILKQYKGKKFSDYINGLRIIYITEMLYKNPIYREYKISYLAESCGFASREVFAVVFKKETGISPSYFINNLRKESGGEGGPPTNMFALQ